MSTASTEPSAETADAETNKDIDPVRRFTRIILYILAALFAWYVMADRLAPWTDQARVQAYVVPITPEVSGKIIDINVQKDQEVAVGTVLAVIDQHDYQLAVTNAESDLEMAGQEIGAGTASVSTAQSKLVEARANLEHVLVQSKRVYEVEKKGVVSKSDGDKARAAVKQAKAQVQSAQSELQKAKQNLGRKGKDNPRIQAALADLEKAQLDLSRTTIIAPSHGGITNLKVDIGHFANVGVPILTFIEVENIWVQANLRENSIANIKVGTPVDISLDVAPGRIFKGSVTSLGFAVGQDNSSAIGGLENIQGSNSWLRDAQRFPVIITFDDNTSRGLRRLGGQADVQFYGDNSLLNGLGWAWIRLLSYVSYVY